MTERRIIALFTLIALLCAGLVGGAPQFSLIFLPGTQPGQVVDVDTVATCFQCHQTQPGGLEVNIGRDWAGSMMAHSARDPIFFAALAVANKYNEVSGEYCIRCHAPTGWLAGRSKNPDGTDLIGTDFDGVQCDYCHRAANPIVPDTTVPIVLQVPGFGNAMHAVQAQALPKRGPYSDAFAPHDIMYDPFQRSSELCGVCHNVSNPFYADDRINQSPHEYGRVERTYSEWLLSWYATQGEAGTCQACHMPRSPGYGCTLPSSPLRPDLAQHDLTGGNTFVPDILSLFWEGLDTVALQLGKQRAIATLRRAAELDVVAGRSGDSVLAFVRITNRTGHKLPTGYPEGRRMWINVVATSANGDTVFQSGRYDFATAILHQDPQIKVYQAKHGMTDSIAQLYNLPPGPSFHFILNDTVFFDNRIPPRGFVNAEFAAHLADPVGYVYADSQYWDITQYILPQSATSVSVKLYYQTASREYIEFLRDENIGNIHDWNEWGLKLYNAWFARGKSTPVIMNDTTVTVLDSIPMFVPIEESPIPVRFSLLQNFPNPFNPISTIQFSLERAADVRLNLYDILGRGVRVLAEGIYPAGIHSVTVDASELSSGVYMYSLTVNSRKQTRKLVILK